MPSDFYQTILTPSLKPGYRCSINVSPGQNTKKRAVPQMAVCFNTGLALLSSSASVTFAGAAFREQVVASFTPTAGALVL